MGIPVLILGESGSGKTYSLKNFDPAEVGIFSVRKGTLPFPEGRNFKIAKNADYQMIYKVLQNPTLKTYVVDDSQFLMVNEFFRKANDTGYQKYTSIGKNFSDLFEFIAYHVPDDVIVYFIMHEDSNDYGETKLRTIGKLLNDKVCIEGMCTVVLRCVIENGQHFFLTQGTGTDISKSPEGLFDELKIPNDLKAVDSAIREYWNI